MTVHMRGSLLVYGVIFTTVRSGRVNRLLLPLELVGLALWLVSGLALKHTVVNMTL